MKKFHQLLAVGRWFPPGTPVSSTRKLISSSFHHLDMTLAVAEALNPNKPNQTLDLVIGVRPTYGHHAIGVTVNWGNFEHFFILLQICNI